MGHRREVVLLSRLAQLWQQARQRRFECARDPFQQVVLALGVELSEATQGIRIEQWRARRGGGVTLVSVPLISGGDFSA